MTITELIATLETIRAEHGDVDIAAADCDRYGHYEMPTTYEVKADYVDNGWNEYVYVGIDA